ncbi:MAG: hypothetical protein HZB80_01860 [Deltaproteobacteria bacterium]|nr:hypothetical protein [Deltaproteobacteria bacterium]
MKRKYTEFKELLEIACKNEGKFIEIVRRESSNIPLPVRMFIADKIRNAVMGMDEKRSRTITEALATVGI